MTEKQTDQTQRQTNKQTDSDRGEACKGREREKGKKTETDRVVNSMRQKTRLIRASAQPLGTLLRG